VNWVYSLVDRVHGVQRMVNQYQIDFWSLAKVSRAIIFCNQTGMRDLWVTAAAWPLGMVVPWGSDELDGEATSSYDTRSGEVLWGNQAVPFGKLTRQPLTALAVPWRLTMAFPFLQALATSRGCYRPPLVSTLSGWQ
jgi:hypothetical protein